MWCDSAPHGLAGGALDTCGMARGKAQSFPQCTWVPFAELPQPALVRNGLLRKLPEHLGVHASLGEARAKVDLERLKGKDLGEQAYPAARMTGNLHQGA